MAIASLLLGAVGFSLLSSGSYFPWTQRNPDDHPGDIPGRDYRTRFTNAALAPPPHQAHEFSGNRAQ